MRIHLRSYDANAHSTMLGSKCAFTYARGRGTGSRLAGSWRAGVLPGAGCVVSDYCRLAVESVAGVGDGAGLA